MTTTAAAARPLDRTHRDEATTLGARLRVETHDAHLAAERAFDLDRRLSSLQDYGDALLAIEALHRHCDHALQAVAGSLPAQLRDGPARRRARLADDLSALHRAPRREPPPSVAPQPVDLDAALGIWYVHEGAALGGLLIAREIRRRLPQALPAARFFAGEGRATAARWRAFQQALAAWPGAPDRVVAGALRTFAEFSESMSQPAA